MLNHHLTPGYPAVTDFRDSDAWNEARVLVCVLLDLSGRLARRSGLLVVARALEHHAVSLLDSLARGYAQGGWAGDLEDARHALDQLESLVQDVRASGTIAAAEYGPLEERIDLVMRSLNVHRYRHAIVSPNHRRWE